jgi:hypothetical protein
MENVRGCVEMWLSARRVTTKVTTVLGSFGVKPNVRVVPIARLVLDEKNANKGTKRGRELLGASLDRIPSELPDLATSARDGHPFYRMMAIKDDPVVI